MAAFNHAQDPYVAALELLVLELGGAIINAGLIDRVAFMRRLQMYAEFLQQDSMPKSRQGALELVQLMECLGEISPLSSPEEVLPPAAQP